ncbi:MAG TPA: amidohydrolase family protein, partial [Steroidobacteraceae bacterium]|nr:amidohydrolase family protein [Steroidobacteraceae bacterium]
MKRIVAILVGVFATLSAEAAELLIEKVTVVSPEQPRPLVDRYVLIRNERIATISDKPIKVSALVVRVDGNGKFLTPGLMDSHVHVSATPGLDYLPDEKLAPLVRAYTKQQPRSYLYFGVTQLLDLSNTSDAITAFNAQPLHPDLFRCGAAPALNGYPVASVPVPARYRLLPDYIFEPANKDELPSGTKASEHTPEAVVARIASSDAKCVKIFIETGFGGTKEWPILSNATMDRVRELAHARGLLVVAHANALDSQRIAVVTHVDVLAHGLWSWTGVDDKGGVPSEIAEHLQEVHAQKIGWQATLRVLPGIQEMYMSGTLDDPVYKKVVPSQLLAWYRTEEGEWFKRETRGPRTTDALDPVMANIFARGSDRGMRATHYLYELGHTMLLGSDTPAAPTYGSQPGYDTYREMRLLAQAGVKLKDVFAAAT